MSECGIEFGEIHLLRTAQVDLDLVLMDGGAESPQEIRTRLLLVRLGLPKPETQTVVQDGFNYPFARIDMGYREWKVGIQFDGAQLWTDPAQRTADIDRYAELAALGWLIIQVSSDLLRYRPEVVVTRVCAALREARERLGLRCP